MTAPFIVPNANVLKHPRAKLADVQCSRMKTQPGDKFMVRVYQKLSPAQIRRLQNAVQKWAGDVEVLIVDCTVFDVELLHQENKGIISG